MKLRPATVGEARALLGLEARPEDAVRRALRRERKADARRCQAERMQWHRDQAPARMLRHIFGSTPAEQITVTLVTAATTTPLPAPAAPNVYLRSANDAGEWKAVRVVKVEWSGRKEPRDD